MSWVAEKVPGNGQYMQGALVRVFNFSLLCLALASFQTRATPAIDAQMDLVCASSSCGTNWSKEATGLAGNDCPAFCYRIGVSNSGNVALTNISVNDNLFGDLTPAFGFPAIFSRGEIRTLFLQATVCSSRTNRILVTGQEISSAYQTSQTNSAVTRVLLAPAPLLSCQVFLTSPDDADNNPSDGRVTFPPDGDPHWLTNGMVVCNFGTVDADILQVTDPPLEAFGAACSNAIRSLHFSVPAGQCRTVAVCAVFLPECYWPKHEITLLAQATFAQTPTAAKLR